MITDSDIHEMFSHPLSKIRRCNICSEHFKVNGLGAIAKTFICHKHKYWAASREDLNERR